MQKLGELLGNYSRKCESCGKEMPPDSSFKTCKDCYLKNKKPPQSRHSQSANPKLSLPDGYLENGYFSDAEKKYIFPDLVNTLPEEIAQSLGKDGITSTKLRRFYTKTKVIEQRLDANTPFAEVVAELLELKQHAANAVGKAQSEKERKGLEILKQFIDCNIDLATQDEDSFRKGFLLHFQGVVAYFKYHNPKK